jgi:hypothetical protein
LQAKLSGRGDLVQTAGTDGCAKEKEAQTQSGLNDYNEWL